MHIRTMYRLFSRLVFATPALAWAGAPAEDGALPIAEYSVRPDPRDCVSFPECGGYFLYEINGAGPAINNDLCTADFPLAGYVVRTMQIREDGSLVEFFPSCDQPTVGSIEPDPEYKGYDMLVSPLR